MASNQVRQPAGIVVHNRQTASQVVEELIGGGTAIEGRNIGEHHQAEMHRLTQKLGQLRFRNKWQEVAVLQILCSRALLEIFFTATIVLIAILPWYFLSDLKFLADMGLLLVMVMLINMVIALVVIPLEVWFVRPKFLASKDLMVLEREVEQSEGAVSSFSS